MLAYEAELKNKVSLYKSIITVANQLNIKSEWLAAVIYNESKFNSKALNPISNAVGLIQWMPSSLPKGLTTKDMLNLSDVEQMHYVYLYFLPYKSKIKNIYDVYVCVFFPAALGKTDDYIFQTTRLSAQLIATQNKIFDLNKDGKITLLEFKKYIKQIMIPKRYINFIDFGNKAISILMLIFVSFVATVLYVNKI